MHFSIFLKRRPRENKVLLHWRDTTSSTFYATSSVDGGCGQSKITQRNASAEAFISLSCLNAYIFMYRGNSSTERGVGQLVMWAYRSGEDLQSLHVITVHAKPFFSTVAVSPIWIQLWWLIFMLLLEDYSESSVPGVNPQNNQEKCIFNWLVPVCFAGSTVQYFKQRSPFAVVTILQCTWGKILPFSSFRFASQISYALSGFFLIGCLQVCKH